MKIITTQISKFQYFYPYTVAVVGARSADRTNFMACAWHTALSFDPPLFGVLISKKRFTYQIVAEAKEFTVNFLAREDIKLSAQMGRISGHDQDKIEAFAVNLSDSVKISSPVLTDAYVSLECTLEDIQNYGDHDLFIGRVAAVHEKEKSFTPEGVLNVEQVSPLLYMGSDSYITTDADSFKKQLP